MSEPTGIGTGSGFVQDLDSPEQSLRLQSIEQCFSRGSSDVILQALLGRQVQETDPECQALLGGAISAVRRRLAKALPRTLPTDPEVFAAFFKEQGPADRLEILADLTAAQVRAFSAVAPALLAEEAEGLTAASIVRTFGRSWPKDALQVLGRSLGAPSISLRAAALDVLAQLAPQSLLRELPKLLIGRDPRLRALAIKGLAAIDLDEAVEHLQALLAHPATPNKLAGLQACFYLPFGRIKIVLLWFMAMEANPGLLQRAGLLFEINPDIEVPYRLWELTERLSPARSAVVRAVFQGACKVLQASGVLGSNLDPYLNQLREWVRQRKMAVFIQGILSQIDLGQPLLPETEAAVSRSVADENFRKSLERSLTWPIAQPARAFVLKLLSASPAPEPAADVHPVAINTGISAPAPAFEARPSIEKIRLIGALLADDRQTHGDLVRKLVLGADTASDLRAAALRAALRMEVLDLAPSANKYLKCGNSALVCASLEYLGSVDPDGFFPRLGQFLQNSNGRIKGTALKILQQYDMTQAVSMLRTILYAPIEGQRSAALACLTNFDFPLIRNLVSEFLIGHYSSQDFDFLLCLFQSNPDPGNLYPLFRLERLLPPEPAAKVKTARKANESFLTGAGQLNQADAPKREEEFARRFAAEEEKKKKPLPDYALKKLVPEQTPFQEALAGFFGLFSEGHGKLFAVAFVIVVVGVMVSRSVSLIPDSRKPEPVAAGRSAFELAPGANSLASLSLNVASQAGDLPAPSPQMFVVSDPESSRKNMDEMVLRAAARREARRRWASAAAGKNL